MTSTCSELTSSGRVEWLPLALTPATSSCCVDGLSSAQTPAQDGGSVDGLSSARSPTVSPGGSVEGNGGSIHGGCVGGLSSAQTPAVDSGMHRLSNARTATVSHTVENDSSNGLPNARMAVMDHTADGRVNGLVFAQTSAVDSAVPGLPNAQTPTVSLSVANTQLLPGDATPSPTMSRRAGDGSAGMHACGSCSFVSASLQGLRQHERRRHPADFPEEACMAMAAVFRVDASLLCLTIDDLEEVISLAVGSKRDPSETGWTDSTLG